MKARAFFALAALFAFTAATPAKKPSDSQQLTFVVQTLLAQAPQNFASMRLAKIDTDADFTSYKVKPFGTHCHACTMYDEYAHGTYKENWYVFDRWNLPSKMTPAKSEAYATQALRRVVAGFALHRTVSKFDKYPTLLWRSADNRWVSVATSDDGYGIRVGRDLAKPVHVLLPPTSAQIKQLVNAATNFIRLGAPAASSNFDSLRTASPLKNALGEDDYPVSASFGPMLRKCEVSNVTNSLGYKDFVPKWVLSCDVIAMAASRDAIKPVLHDAVEDALPDGFNPTTDPTMLVLDDYRWDGTDVSVDVGSYESNGVVHFELSIYHYLPKPADSGN
jgi:hypothetical protein